jgi:hypothetical protein
MDGTTMPSQAGELFALTDPLGLDCGNLFGTLVAFGWLGMIQVAKINTGTEERVVYVRMTTGQLADHQRKELIMQTLSVPK